VPHLRIDDLVRASDVVAIAEVTKINMLGTAPPIFFHDQQLPAETYSGDLLVKRMIKGVAADHLTVKYALPVSFVGYRGLHLGTRMVFLRREGDHYALADAYYADFPAVLPESENERSHTAAGDDTTTVVREMLAVIASAQTSSAEKSEVLRVDYAFPVSEEAVAEFRKGLANAHEPELRQRLQGNLISFGDMTELPNVVNLLLKSEATENQKIWLLYVIGNRLNDPRSLPVLQPLLRAGNNPLRETAVEALWHIADVAAIPALLVALQDPDEEVRFYAVRALSDIAKEPGWGGPSQSEFREHQQEYLAHWQNWAKSRAR
jgi:hypothetical protein